VNCDVAIIGGGPAGATVGTLLKKYNPNLDVAILEKERFPRDHVGESLLPPVTRILDEMGVWDKIEAANFPIKLGAAYRWGREKDKDLYYFNFLPKGVAFQDQARPGVFKSQRADLAFQVDRCIYDKVLLDHAAECGCSVFEQSKVTKVLRQGDRVEGLAVGSSEDNAELSMRSLGSDPIVKAKYYVDASGSESVLRKAMGVGTEQPSVLRNIAIWGYWQNTEWAERIGNGGTYVYVLSIGWGWIWFIPIGSTRTSIGVVTPAGHYKESGKSIEDLYAEALASQQLVTELTARAKQEGPVRATKDWSFVADRLCGENWFLAGDSAGFADPILAAGLTLAQTGARRVAFSILELERGKLEADWLKNEYQRVQRKNTQNHIRFAEYWYSANEQFTDLKQYCTEIAQTSGLSLDPDDAFRWLGTGGFTDEFPGSTFGGTFEVTAVKRFVSRFSGQKAEWIVRSNNIFEFDCEGAIEESQAIYEGGAIVPVLTLRKGAYNLPIVGIYKYLFAALQLETEIVPLLERFAFEAQRDGFQNSRQAIIKGIEALEALVAEGWVKASFRAGVPLFA
jgi:flavin-dependent dehydrogenase